MNLALHGGFGEKGRTCFGVASGGYRLLVDAGVKTSARGHADYYPALDASELAAYDARAGRIEFTTWTPHAGSLAYPPEVRGGRYEMPLPGLRGAKHLRLFAGQPDPADAACFTIPYEIDGRTGWIDGTLREGGRVGLDVRGGDVTPP